MATTPVSNGFNERPSNVPRGNGTEEEEIHALQQINDSLPHKLTLELWEREEGVLSRRIEQKDARRMSIQNEIYQLLGLCFVFQGVVLTALFQAAAQPNPSTCANWWSPFSLTVIAFLATLGAVSNKFNAQSQIERQLVEEKKDCRALFKSIQDLRSKGTRFPLSRPPPKRHPEPEPEFLSGCLEYWCSYRGGVTITLMAFTVITSVSCKRLLCPGRASSPSPSPYPH